MAETAVTSATLAQSTDRVYFVERFYSLVAGATDERIRSSLRKDIQSDALHAAYAVEAWLEEVQAREEKYDRLATLARAVSPITDLLRVLSSGAYSGVYESLIADYEEKHLRSILAQRFELSQSAGEAGSSELLAPDDDPLTALLTVVTHPDGRDDYVAWFQIGWLYWKRGILDEAENAFRTAASFSQRQSLWYLAQSLRHEAFMQWRRGNLERSRVTIRRAIDLRRDPSLLIEAARYSAACKQNLESQALIDEALHADPLIFLAVLSDSEFAGAITSTLDILVRQQTRAAEAARAERQLWESAIKTIRQAERKGNIVLLSEDADEEFASSALPEDPAYPIAIYRAEQARSSRLAWTHYAVERIDADVVEKTAQLRTAENRFTAAEQAADTRINSIDNEQRIAEMVIQDERDTTNLPTVPPWKDEALNGLMVGIGVLVVGGAIIAGLSQWKFGSIPPLVPIPIADVIIIVPLLVVMLIFGVLGVVTLPMIRLQKARTLYENAVHSAEFDADQKLRKVANDAARLRESARQEWATAKVEFESIVDDAARQHRAAVSAHTTIKRIPITEK